MDWFEAITGFAELDYEQTQARLAVKDGFLVSRGGERQAKVGRLEIPSLLELRHRAQEGADQAEASSRCSVSCLQADVRRLHADPANAGALFQVASQFNLLEMVGPAVTPEQGVTRYSGDGTQGPACAMAAGAATIYRNYLVPLNGQVGQRAHRQVDCLADLGVLLGNGDGSLWEMENGYAMLRPGALAHIDRRLADMSDAQRDELHCALRIGLHWEVEVTDLPAPAHVVSQAFCSALPVAYQRHPQDGGWQRFAQLILEAAYEATLVAGALNARRGASCKVFLTRIGGGVFGNDIAWIHAAIERALKLVRTTGLDVVIVTLGAPDRELQHFVQRSSGSAGMVQP